ncbi:MAG: hypothetical protein B1H08_01655 [Candidatus Omnitrophica bacterium 4484_171]|nr:MAG: hypothetical protein B1H08_01655 [Candidatus Omnitrophica bacterium 4484_171]
MDKSYWELFFGESEEYLSRINQFLVALEKDSSDTAAINEIFRLIHTLKGMAATMGFNDLAEFAHKIEDIFDSLRSGRSSADPNLMDIIFSCVDAIGTMLEDLHNKRKSSIVVSEYINRLEDFMSEEEHAEGGGNVPSAVTKPDTAANMDITPQEKISIESALKDGFDILKVDIHLAKDCPMKEARAFLVIIRVKQIGKIIKAVPSEEDIREGKFDLSFTIIFATKESIKVVKDELNRVLEIERVDVKEFNYSFDAKEAAPKTEASYLKKIQSMRIPVERLDKIMNFMGELSIAKSRLMQTVQSGDLASIEETSFIIDRLVSALQDETLQMRLLPISYILDAFPRIVRDFTRKSNKDVDLRIIGSEIELDRVILDEIGDPIMHIVRNAIDHGIEDIDERRKSGKNPKAKLLIKVSRQKGHVIIEISDDGRGIDFEELRRKAIEKGMVAENELFNIDEKAALDIMATPGFSTSKEITDISGRGVGLDVVRTKLDALGGRIDLETEIGKGTRFFLTLPLTLAIIKAMLVSVDNEIFAVPLMNIRESVKIDADTVKTIQNREVIKVRNEIIPLIRLDKEICAHYKKEYPSRLSVVVVEGRIKSLGLLVDKIAGEQDIVVKPLGSMIRKVKGIAGATILGDGKVALILDVANII